jgi:hypothetical protein
MERKLQMKGFIVLVSFAMAVLVLSFSLQGCSGGTGSTSAAQKAVLSSVVVTPDEPALIAGSSLQLIATAYFTDGTSRDISSTVTWHSSKDAVATVNSVGLVSSSTPGTTLITATTSVDPGSKAGSVMLTVTDRARIPATGQSTSYFPGDDGNLQNGIAQPNPRFESNGDGTIRDGLTGLMWLRDANCIQTNYPAFDNDSDAGDGKVVWQHALDFANSVNNGLYPSCSAGYSDWRLPNINELKSLANAGVGSATWLNAQGFIGVQPDYYWSSTTDVGIRERALTFPMRSASWIIENEDKPVGLPVMLVRDGSAGVISLPRTGQTECFDTAGALISCAKTGQDGDLKKGVPLPNVRFTNPDGTTPPAGNLIKDQLTGLVWTRSAKSPGPAACLPGSAKVWVDALRYIDCLNTNRYEGASDWRLPNINEYESLLSMETYLPQEGFDIEWGYFLSSTAISPTQALSIQPAYKRVHVLLQSFPTMVWPVRGGILLSGQ